MAVVKGPKTITIKGRLSFPTWTAQAAYDWSLKGKYPFPSVAKATPSFNLLLEKDEYEAFLDHVLTGFFPNCADIFKKDGEDANDALSADDIKKLTAQLKAKDFEGDYNVPFKSVSEKSLELMPTAVASIRVVGNKGVDLVQKAVVREERELAVPDPNMLSFKQQILPIKDTVHELYPGSIAASTLNLYAYHNGKLPGFSASASTVVFVGDADRFGGGVAVDEDAIFMDD